MIILRNKRTVSLLNTCLGNEFNTRYNHRYYYNLCIYIIIPYYIDPATIVFCYSYFKCDCVDNYFSIDYSQLENIYGS